MKNLGFGHFIKVLFITSIWIHISEVFRYFVFVIPTTKEFFPERANVAEMNAGIFVIWGIWDMLLTALVVCAFFGCMQLFGNNRKSIGIAALFSWLFFFVLFWVGTANMGLASWNTLLITLPLSALEMWAACYIVSELYRRNALKQTLV